MASTEQYYGTGRRKSSTARVFMRSGRGAIIVNDIIAEQTIGNRIGEEVVRMNNGGSLREVFAIRTDQFGQCFNWGPADKLSSILLEVEQVFKTLFVDANRTACRDWEYHLV